MTTVSTGSEEQIRSDRRAEPSHRAEYAARLILLKELDVLQGTVTGFLERLVGEPIDARGHHHKLGLAAESDHIPNADGRKFVHRFASLTGRISLQPYVHATTAIDTSRLPHGLCRRLEESNEPIGRVLAEFCVKTTRRPLAEDLFPQYADKWVGGGEATKFLYSRTYLMDVAGQPVMSISEWFLPNLIVPLLSGRS